jgi:hypothetical protein
MEIKIIKFIMHLKHGATLTWSTTPDKPVEEIIKDDLDKELFIDEIWIYGNNSNGKFIEFKLDKKFYIK